MGSSALNVALYILLMVATMQGADWPIRTLFLSKFFEFLSNYRQGLSLTCSSDIVHYDGKVIKGANPQRVSTEIIIEIKQLYSGRIALNPFTANNRRYMVYPLRDDFPIENGFLFVYIFLYFDVTWPF